MKLRFVALSLAFAVAATSMMACGREGQVTGQVFVVTQGRENVKLGLVPIFAIPEAELQPFLDGKAKQIAAEYEPIRKVFDQCLSDRPPTDPATLDNCYGKNSFETAAKFERAAQISSGFAYLEHAISLDFLLPGSPPPPPPTVFGKTDADGRFSLKVQRRGRYAIVAFAARAVPGQEKKEEYAWFLWATVSGSTLEVFLSNDNMMTQNPADAVVRVPPALPPPNWGLFGDRVKAFIVSKDGR